MFDDSNVSAGCKKQSTTIKGINSVLISEFFYRKYMPMIAS